MEANGAVAALGQTWETRGSPYVKGMNKAEHDANARLEQLYRDVAPLVHRRCATLLGDGDDALDAVQDIFLKLRANIDSFRGEAQLTTWIYRIATNHCLNVLRSRKTAGRARRTLSLSAPRATQPSAHNNLERRQYVARLLERYTPRQVQIVLHTYFDEMTQTEIGQVLGISDRAVRKALKKVLDSMRDEVEHLEPALGGNA